MAVTNLSSNMMSFLGKWKESNSIVLRPSYP
jgi:hypothetical protein